MHPDIMIMTESAVAITTRVTWYIASWMRQALPRSGPLISCLFSRIQESAVRFPSHQQRKVESGGKRQVARWRFVPLLASLFFISSSEDHGTSTAKVRARAISADATRNSCSHWQFNFDRPLRGEKPVQPGVKSTLSVYEMPSAHPGVVTLVKGPGWCSWRLKVPLPACTLEDNRAARDRITLLQEQSL